MSAVPNIRRMKIDDLDRIMALETELFTDPWSRQSYLFEICTNRFSLPVVMEIDDVVMGYAVVWRLYGEFHLATFGIAPNHQGNGWGRYLLEKLLDMADVEKRAILEVRRSNHRAKSLYESFGFREIAMRMRYYKNGEDALVMEKRFD